MRLFTYRVGSEIHTVRHLKVKAALKQKQQQTWEEKIIKKIQNTTGFIEKDVVSRV